MSASYYSYFFLLNKLSDGELCDELGHIQLNTESPTRPRQLQLEQTSSVEILATRALAHAELSSSNAYYVGWWTR